MYKDIPVLITGGCGFIGSHLAEKLVEYGARVTIIDNLSTGSLINIEHIQDKITFINASITDPQTCLGATQDKRIIFHLAAFISVPESLEKPDLCHATNVDGIFNLLEAARINNVERFVFSSSAAVYGNYEGACTETTPCTPESPYGFSKLIGEWYCKQYAHNFNLKTVTLRYFNVYGKRQNPNGHYAAVVAKFKCQMNYNLPITIFGDGMQTRDFIPVEKVVEANLNCALLPSEFMNGEIYNIATGTSITVLALVDLLKKEFPSYAQEILFASERPGDLKHSYADCSKYCDAIQKLSQL